jgi:hypothetical protein
VRCRPRPVVWLLALYTLVLQLFPIMHTVAGEMEKGDVTESTAAETRRCVTSSRMGQSRQCGKTCTTPQRRMLAIVLALRCRGYWWSRCPEVAAAAATMSGRGPRTSPFRSDGPLIRNGECPFDWTKCLNTIRAACSSLHQLLQLGSRLPQTRKGRSNSFPMKLLGCDLHYVSSVSISRRRQEVQVITDAL